MENLFNLGDHVKVSKGPFKGRTGTVSEYVPESMDEPMYIIMYDDHTKNKGMFKQSDLVLDSLEK